MIDPWKATRNIEIIPWPKSECLSCERAYPGTDKPCASAKSRVIITCSNRCNGKPYPCENCDRKITIGGNYIACPVKIEMKYKGFDTFIENLASHSAILPIVAAIPDGFTVKGYPIDLSSEVFYVPTSVTQGRIYVTEEEIPIDDKERAIKVIALWSK